MHEWLLGALVLAAAATAANGLQLGLEGFYFRKGRLLVIMDVNLEVIHEAIGCARAKSEFILGPQPVEFNLWVVMPQVIVDPSSCWALCSEARVYTCYFWSW